MDTYDDDKNYINPQESGSTILLNGLACLIINEPAENQTKDKKLASKLANLLKGLEILASKKNILDHINRNHHSWETKQTTFLRAYVTI
ncbi:hypothetical protein BH23THE1_BH23THE1_06700 [soil metagenome]